MRWHHETHQERINRLALPHRWFAWRPVYVGLGDLRWLEWVGRRGAYEGRNANRRWVWAYSPA